MSNYTGLEIAVIGLAGKFPDADTISEFWENLRTGKDSISTFSEEEALREDTELLVKNPAYVRANAFLKNKHFFDAAFFNYRPDEAELMDPQLRLYHECCWQALEDSGYNPVDNKEKIGVFSAGSPNPRWILHAVQQNNAGAVDEFTASHLRDVTFLSSRISYKLNLKGPAMFVQTACSSSLVAVHEACNSLLLGECTMALAGGVNIQNYSRKGYVYQKGMIHSRDGKCRPFDKDSSGTVGGEGAGVVVLKRLKDALRDGDPVYAIVKGTAINNDGSGKVGFTAPGVNGQTEVIRNAHKRAGVTADSISYVEAHGTATELGDVIELEALHKAFGAGQPATTAIGAVKSNIGHLDSAAGIAGFIKTVLALHHRVLPPSLHFTSPNARLEFSKGPFYVNAASTAWANTSGPLRAGVSSFGIGGTNAHVVLEEAPPKAKPARVDKKYQLLVWSGKTNGSAAENGTQLKQFLAAHPEANLADVAYTLQTGRERFKYRTIAVAGNKAEAIQAIENKEMLHSVANAQEKLQQVVFLFPGQGAQYTGMCRDLYLHESVFRSKVDECLKIAAAYTKESLLDILFAYQPDGVSEAATINNTRYAQPLLFIVEYAMACLFMNWGIKPDSMMGHSIGEYTAACISGVLSLEDAVRLVIRRGELVGQAETGSMVSVNMTEAEFAALPAGNWKADLAVINSATSLVLAGTHGDIERLETVLAEAGYAAKRMHTSHAFHSFMMKEIVTAFEKELAQVKMNTPAIPYISNVTGTYITQEQINDPSYWVKHLLGTVQFLKGTETLLQDENVVLVEVGPGKALSNYVKANAAFGDGHRVVNTVRQAKQQANDQRYLAEKLGVLWMNGLNINWNNYYGDAIPARISLPAYAFEKTAYTTDFNIHRLLANNNQAADNQEENTIEDLVYRAAWKRAVTPETATAAAGTTLLFQGVNALGDQLKKRLEALGRQVITVKPEMAFRKEAARQFRMNEADPAHHAALWQLLDAEGVQVQQVIYMGTLDEQFVPVKYTSSVATLEAGYLAVSYLARGIAGSRQAGPVQLSVITNQLACVTEEDQTNPVKAALLAPAKIMPSEISTISCKVIDIPYPFTTGIEWENGLSAICNELFYKTEEPLVAYRAKARWVPCYDAMAGNETVASQVSLLPKGTYLITGALGGIGFTLAEHLATQYQANLLLVHRSDFPARDEWNNWLQLHGPDDEISKQVLQLQQWEEGGSAIFLYRADVTDEKQVRAIADQINVAHPVINGVIWAVGEIDYGGIMLNRAPEHFISYSNAKIAGLLLFEKYLSFERLDFLALFSSVGNVLYQVKFGQVGYNAGNEFLEAYAGYIRKRMGIHAFTINWCDWLDVGLTVKAVKKDTGSTDLAFINTQIHKGIYPAKGVDIFRLCLENKAAVYSIYKSNLPAAIRFQRNRLKEMRAGEAAMPQLAPVNNNNSLEQVLLQLYGDFFGNPSITAKDDFFELGGDSLKAMSLVARINKQLAAALTIKDIYEQPTITGLLKKLAAPEATNQPAVEIPVAAAKEAYTASSAQKRMFYLQSMEKDSVLYNETELLWVHGAFDVQKAEAAFRRIIQRHESLRSYFIVAEDGLQQVVANDFSFTITTAAFEEAELEQVVEAFVRPFDLQSAPLIRVAVLQKNKEEHLLLMDSHHIVMDGISRFILREEFLAFYNEQELAPLRIQYKDYAEWQQTPGQQQLLDKEKQFWLKEFAEEVPVPELPLDFPRPLVRSTEGAVIAFAIPEKYAARLKAIAAEEGTTVFTVLLALLNVFLHKITSQEDIVIGTPVAGRQVADLEPLVGMFVNTLALRNQPLAEMQFTQFLHQVKMRSLACFEHQQYPFDELVNELKLQRNSSHNPLFDVMFVFQRYEASANTQSGLQMVPAVLKHTSSRFDITVLAVEEAGALSMRFVYTTALFEKATIQRFAGYFNQLVKEVAVDTTRQIADLSIIPDAEKQLLLTEFSGTTEAYRKDAHVITLFEERVAAMPNAVAVVAGDRQITYKALNNWANQVAYTIREKIAVPGNEPVCLLFDASVDMVAAMLGVLKAGMAYVPLSPDVAADRNLYIFNNCGARLLLLPSRLQVAGNVNELLHPSLVLEITAEAPVKEVKPVANALTPSDLIYIIYTSGTTGNPKGVAVKHGGIVNMLHSFQHIYNIKPGMHMGQIANVCFDACAFEIWPSLVLGGCLYIAADKVRHDPELMKHWVAQHQIAVLFLPTVIAEHFLKEEAFLKQTSLAVVNVAGDRLRYLPSMALPYHIYNLYGPTEDSIWTTWAPWKFDEIKPYYNIGKAIANKKVLVLDKAGRLQPIGVAGELCVAGDGLAEGYVNNPALTAEKFITSPLLPDEKLYKTGDLVRMLADGNLEYLGRVDQQVKIRGFRIEPAEIENHLCRHPQVKECAVVPRGTAGDKYLVAYYVAAEEIAVETFRAFLVNTLPDYMVPGYFMKMDTMPLTSNGKLDRKALPTPELNANKTFVAPVGEKETLLLAIWSKVLGSDTIGVTDHFFSVGGDSIKSIQISTRLRSAGFEATVKDIFTYPTVRQLAAVMKPIKAVADQSEVVGDVLLTPVQQWFFRNAHSVVQHFNQSVLLQFKDRVSKTVIAQIAAKLQDHHDALRMQFAIEGDRLVQYNQAAGVPVWVEEYEATDQETLEALLMNAGSALQKSVNPLSGPLMKLALFHAPDGSRLLIVIHHLVTDGVSWRILFEDIDRLYQQALRKEPFSLPFKTDSFLTWSQSLQQYGNGKVHKKAIRYWNEKAAAPLPLVKEVPAGANLLAHQASCSFRLSKEETEALLHKANYSFNTQINDILLTALSLCSDKLTGKNAVCVDVENHGRHNLGGRENVGRTIGWFTTLYPVQLEKQEEALSDTIKRIKDSLRAIPDNGIDYLLSRYPMNGDAPKAVGHSSAICFNYLGQFDADTRCDSFTIAAERTAGDVSLERARDYELEFGCIITGGTLEVKLLYSQEQYSAGAIQALLDAYRENLLSIIAYCVAYGKQELSVADISYKGLTNKELLLLQQQYDIKDVYALSPMQEGMLFHSLAEEEEGSYCGQMTFQLNGNIDIAVMEQSVNELMARYDILRTFFVHDEFDCPLQVVLKERPVDFQYTDARQAVGSSNRQAVIRENQQRDKRRGFNLAADVLMRLQVLRVADDQFVCIWSYHHILMDGWCTAVLFREFTAIYEAKINKQPITLPPAVPYFRYIEWLEQTDKNTSTAYWRNLLDGYDVPAALPEEEDTTKLSLVKRFSIEHLAIDENETAILQKAARDNGVTLHTLVQAAWGMLLARYNFCDDVVFGSVVSGRPAAIEGIETMVGLFINTVPVRITCQASDSPVELLHRVQEDTLQAETWQYHPLADILLQSKLGRNLFNHILVFENYPSLDNQGGGSLFSVSDVEMFVQSNYDVTVVVAPGDTLEIKIEYNEQSYTKSTIANTLAHFKSILLQMTEALKETEETVAEYQ